MSDEIKFLNLDGVKTLKECLESEAPYIGENGNWFVKGEDTGVSAKGNSGKSAYELWIDAGNEGTEEDFLKSLIPTINSVSVSDFDCTGDGVTDVTANLQVAIEYVESKGGTLYFPPGTYVFSDRLFIKNPIKIIGSSPTNTKLLFVGGRETVNTSKFDETWWEESDSAICVQSNNVSFENIAIDGKVDNTNSTFNGICLHWTHLKNGDTDRDCYYSSEKVFFKHVIMTSFRNNLFIYAGWQRLIENCDFRDATECGIKYYPLELDVVGNWSCSGDILMGCSFVNNPIGFSAQGCYQLLMENCVFEFNNVAIKSINNQDIKFTNCWNEANNKPLYIEGNAKFIGGYNINKDTIDHQNGYVTIEHSDDIVIIKGSETIFHQKNGIIIKGVEIGLELENLLKNIGFYENSQGTGKTPSYTEWEVYGNEYHFSIDTTQLYEGNYTVLSNVEGYVADTNPEFCIRQKLVLDAGKYEVSCNIMAEDRSTLDAGFNIGIIFYDSSDQVIGWDNYIHFLVGNNIWEKASTVFEVPSGVSYVKIKYGPRNNGKVYMGSPSVCDTNVAGKNDVYMKTVDDDPDNLYIYDINGNEIGKVKIGESDDVVITSIPADEIRALFNKN